MIARIWHGWTSMDNADRYQTLLKSEIFSGIVSRAISGIRKIELLRREHETEVEFITIMWFESIEAVKDFAGQDYEAAYVPAAARAILARFDERSQHYKLMEVREI